MKKKVSCLDCKYCFIEDLYHELCCNHPEHKHFWVPKEEFCEDFKSEDLV